MNSEVQLVFFNIPRKKGETCSIFVLGKLLLFEINYLNFAFCDFFRNCQNFRFQNGQINTCIWIHFNFYFVTKLKSIYR